MGKSYRLFGAETSPYSVKVRSFLRYKKLPFDWVNRSIKTEKEFNSLARSPALPLLVSKSGTVAQDSTSIIKALEAAHPSPSSTPDDKICQFVANLIEDYADEWLNKAMFHYRWSNTEDRTHAAKRQINQLFDGYEPKDRSAAESQIAERMQDRLKLVGSTKKNGPIIEASFERFIGLLNAHLEHHLFLFGGCPSIGDFALAGQLLQLMSDPTPGALIRDKAPFVAAWSEFMEDPRPGAPFESWDQVKETLIPLLRDELAVTYLPWAQSNAASLKKKRKTVTLELAGAPYKQNVQKHTGETFKGLSETAKDFSADTEMASALDGTNALELLQAA